MANLETGQMEYWDRNGILVEEFTTTLTGKQIEQEQKRRELVATEAQLPIFEEPANVPELRERDWNVGDMYEASGDYVLVLAVSGGRTGVVITDSGEVRYLDLYTVLSEAWTVGCTYPYTTESAAKDDFKAGWFAPYFAHPGFFGDGTNSDIDDEPVDYNDQALTEKAADDSLSGEREPASMYDHQAGEAADKAKRIPKRKAKRTGKQPTA